jgi:hypothetical protein
MFKNIEQCVYAVQVLLETLVQDAMKLDVDLIVSALQQKPVSTKNALIHASTLNAVQMLCARLITITKLVAIASKAIAEIRWSDVRDLNVQGMTIVLTT